MVAPPGDRLISTAEASVLLGVSRQRVGTLIRQGRLFAWQERPGRNGVPVYLSENQVLRHRDRPDHVARRARYLGETKGFRDPRRLTDRQMWREDVNLGHVEETTAPGENAERDYGEFYTTKQAAVVLGVTPLTIGKMRKRGRLIGHRKPLRKWHGSGEGRWWFYLKEDVHALYHDPDYQRHRERVRRTLLAKAGVTG
jgi:hypothetical protein